MLHYQFSISMARLLVFMIIQRQHTKSGAAMRHARHRLTSLILHGGVFARRDTPAVTHRRRRRPSGLFPFMLWLSRKGSRTSWQERTAQTSRYVMKSQKDVPTMIETIESCGYAYKFNLTSPINPTLFFFQVEQLSVSQHPLS